MFFFSIPAPYSYDPEVLEIILKKEKDRVTQELQQFSQLLTEYGVRIFLQIYY